MANSFEVEFGSVDRDDPFLRGCELSASNAAAPRDNGVLLAAAEVSSRGQEELGVYASLGGETIDITAKSMGFRI